MADEKNNEKTEVTYDSLRQQMDKDDSTLTKAQRAHRLTQLTVGELVGLPAQMASRLQGEDIAAMRADAERLKADLTSITEAAVKQSNPAQEQSATDRYLASRRYAVPGMTKGSGGGGTQ